MEDFKMLQTTVQNLKDIILKEIIDKVSNIFCEYKGCSELGEEELQEASNDYWYKIVDQGWNPPTIIPYINQVVKNVQNLSTEEYNWINNFIDDLFTEAFELLKLDLRILEL